MDAIGKSTELPPPDGPGSSALLKKYPHAFDSNGIPKVGTLWKREGYATYVATGALELVQNDLRKSRIQLRVPGTQDEHQAGWWYLRSFHDGVSDGGSIILLEGMGTADTTIDIALFNPRFYHPRANPLELERLMRLAELGSDLGAAKVFALSAHQAHLLHNSLRAEEMAIEEHRVILKATLVGLPAADQTCWHIRGLREFEHYAPELGAYYWYEH